VQEADLLLVVPAVVTGNIVIFLWDVRCLSTLFTRLDKPVAFKDLLPVKGASYFLNIVNYNAGAAAMALVLRKRAQIPFLRGASSLMLMNVVDILALNVLISFGLAVDTDVLSPAVRQSLVVVNAGIYAVIAGSFLYWNAGFDFFVLGRLRGWTIFSAFRRARLLDWGVLLVMRIVLLLLYTTLNYVLLHLFHVPVPYGVLLLVNPVITVIGTLPISVSGIGTTQVAMRHFYGAFASTARIDAFSTTAILLYQLTRVGIASLYVGRVRRELEAEPEPPVCDAPVSKSA
jgi:uncharacterized membrane protein YbhN (UPF0104 family)